MHSTCALYETTLKRLKRDGCAVLVTGEVPPRALRAATRTLFGAPGEGHQRVLALTDPSVGEPTDVLPADAHPGDDRVRVVDGRDAMRTTSTVAVGNSPFEGSPFVDADAGGVEALHLGVSQVLADVTPPDPDAGDLRFSVASLGPLVDRRDREAVRQFVRATADQVRGAQGMAHYLLPVVDDASMVEWFQPAVDARIEVRTTADGPPEHRWHLPPETHPRGRERTSAWHDLPVTVDHGWGRR